MRAAERTEVLVVGAGPAGLATSQALARRGIEHRVIERGERIGYSWANLYDSLVLHTGKHMSALPGMRFPRSAPMFVGREQFVGYLERYARSFALPVETGVEMTGAVRKEGGWRVTTTHGEIEAAALVIATGIIANPQLPRVPERERFGGRVLHSIEYRRPEPFLGRRVLVVGVGNSGGEIASELGAAGAEVTVAVRSGANVVPLRLFGIPIQYTAFYLRKLPRRAQEAVVAAVGKLTELRRGPPVLPRPAHSPLDQIPLIGFHLVDAIHAGKVRVRGAVAEFTPEGMRFADGTEEPFEHVIFATGFRAALAPLGELVRVDERGFALRTDRVTSADQPDLYFVGHNYDATGGLYNIARDAGLVAERIAATATV
jgi:cation diffusion facilitator CzcD-associated flavoprotein CzcO